MAEITKRLLQRINRDGNASDPYESEDLENWLPEASPTGKDCDSYATWKMREILRIDWEMNTQMCIATCWVEPNRQGYHAVLLVYLDGKIYVLDNRFYWVEEIDFFRAKGYDFDRIPAFFQHLMEEDV